MFDLDRFIADLRATLSERSRQPMKEVVARAVSDPAALVGQRLASRCSTSRRS